MIIINQINRINRLMINH